MTIPGTEGAEPWQQLIALVAFMIGTGLLAAFTQWRGRIAADRKVEEKTVQATNTVGHMMVMQPSADRLTTDTLVQTLATLTVAVNKLIDRLELDATEEALDEKAQEIADRIELKRMVEEIKKSRANSHE